MRRVYEEILKTMFHREIIQKRYEMNFTQAKMSERLEMSERSYADIENGRSCCSALTLALYLIYCCDDLDGFLGELKVKLEKADEDVA